MTMYEIEPVRAALAAEACEELEGIEVPMNGWQIGSLIVGGIGLGLELGRLLFG